jgi:hypothetical protein
MKKRIIAVCSGLALIFALQAQVQNVNIGGSFSGTFMLSGSGAAEYEIGGSPYLNEAWMFGSLEMRSELIENSKRKSKNKAELRRYEAKIAKIDALIAKLSDPSFEAKGLGLMMEGSEEQEEGDYELYISNEDFSGIEGITLDLKSKLIFHLQQLKGEYEAEINDFFELQGLFRYNLYAQEFEMVYGADTFAISAPFNVETITISNMQFMHGLYVKRGLKTQLGSSYFQILSQGECKLLMRHDVKIKSGSGPVTHGWAGGGDAFVQYQHLYYQETDGAEVIPIKKRRKLIKKLFADQQDEVEKFIRAENINIHDDAGLARVFEYYDSLNT